MPRSRPSESRQLRPLPWFPKRTMEAGKTIPANRVTAGDTSISWSARVVGRAAPGFLLELLNFRHERFIGNQRLPSSQNVPVANDAVLIHNKVRASSDAPSGVQNAVGGDRLEIGIVADQREVELQEIGEGFLRERDIGADSDHFGVQLLELLVIVPTGRKFPDSRGSKVQHVKLDEDAFRPLKAAQLEFAALGTRQPKVGSFVSDLDGRPGSHPKNLPVRRKQLASCG